MHLALPGSRSECLHERPNPLLAKSFVPRALENCGQGSLGSLKIIIQDYVSVLVPMLNVPSGFLQTQIYGCTRILAPPRKPFPLRNAPGRQHVYAHYIVSERVSELPGTLPVNVERNIATRGQAGFDE